MKATLHLKNIGGLREGDFVFSSGKLNLIESANSSGKTSIVRALTGILSIPRSGILSESMFKEALKLGVKTDPRNPFEGFVYIHANHGEVEIEFGENREKYVVKQDGEIIVAPESGEERFLLAGILSNNSRVLRQLRGLDYREPDDFRWAVEELSYAKNYSYIAGILKTQFEDFIEKRERVKSNIKELDPLEKRRSALENDLMKLDSEISTLTEELIQTLPERERLKKSLIGINRLKEEIQSKTIEKTKIKRTQLDPKRGEMENAKANKKKAESKSKEVKKEIHKLKKKESQILYIEQELNKLIKDRNILDGMLNLYIIAESNIREEKGDKITCPLCKIGHVTYEEILQNIDKYREQRAILNSNILKLNQEKQSINIQLDRNMEKEKRLLNIIWEQSDKIMFIKSQLKKPEDAIRQIDHLIDEYNTKLITEQKKYNVLRKNMSGKRKDTELNEINRLRSSLHEELGSVRQKISDLSTFEIFGNAYEPYVAKLICNDVITLLKSKINYIENKAEEERKYASKRFNESINILLKNLGFKEFRAVRLTSSPSYRLYVERYDPKKKDYKSQSVGTLSTSEKLAISVILQIALKETYLKKIPFIIMDDILEDFDPERRERVIDYLKEKAAKENWFIIATKLVEEIGPPKVIYV